ncbi:MAG: ATP-binding protein [Haliscomenobacter sp.]|uniref:AAA family ATPase n=1 Tax=Haliscomenobacter sp. TaxID=2717303 RepID=UPI0029BE95D0|nr:ATP-binding protein [Haliscomenobacter sp.]MDX2071756.1 ATP-binding protein [Haliscomenobacter sp.]
MLITFRVSNFLSFNEEEEFSMLAGKVRKPVRPAVTLATGVEALKLAVIYGANASGKSNLIKAIDFAHKTILRGIKSHFYVSNHFRLEKNNESKPSKFEFEFEVNGKVYAYGFTIKLGEKRILDEWLFELKKSSQKSIFERVVNLNGSTTMKTHPKFKGEDAVRFSIYAQDVESNELLLTILGQKDWNENSAFKMFRIIYNWFKTNLILFYPGNNIYPLDIIDLEDSEDKEFYCDLVKLFRTGINDIEFKSEDANDILEKMPEIRKNMLLENINKGRKHKIVENGKPKYFSKNKQGQIIASQMVTKRKLKDENELVNFDFDDESDGTKRLFDFIPLLWLLKHPDSELTLIIDEIDRSLHPELLHKLTEYYLFTTTNVNSQLIVTTHESSLLDLSLLRRDEVWFVEKNNHGESHIYSLEEFQPRFDKEIRKAYLQGRYGAIPFISDVQQLNWETANAEG